MSQPTILVFSSAHCPYCDRAKALLRHKQVTYEECRVDQDPQARERMQTLAPQARTVPQIVIGDKLVGGCDDLYALEQQGKLDALLSIHS